AAWDPVAGRELWRTATDLGAGVSSLAVHGHTLYGLTVNGRAFMAGRELWRTATDLGAGVSSLAVHGHTLYGLTVNGRAFTVDLRGSRRPGFVPTVGRRADLGPAVGANPRLLALGGILYGVSERSLFRLDRDTLAATVLVELDAEWYSGARLAADEHGVLYTLRGRELVAVRP
ncbi:PQQ-binding-like beta-propeller repeat protein, partial [Streptomyces sp. CBMA156]|uniref:PQQ-binding-like beta-propeller repeat protein n=1 Tax=Streptomyces sp. CBMA156 TaxID=1930280 RepID=UPI001661F794